MTSPALISHRSILWAGFLLLGLSAYWFWPSDIAKVEKKTKHILNSMEKKGPESLPISAIRVQAIAELLASNMVFELGAPFPSAMRKSEAISLLAQARHQLSTVTITSLGHEATRIAPDRIDLDMTLDAAVVYRGETEKMMGTYRWSWQKMDDQWLLIAIYATEIIQHPSGGMPWR